MTVYQNFPCQFTSLGSVPNEAAAGGKSSGPVPGAAAHSASATHIARTNQVAQKPATLTAAGTNQPRIGDSESDVRKAWGEPDEVIQDEPPSGPVEIWHYKDGRSVQIRRHRVVAQP